MELYHLEIRHENGNIKNYRKVTASFNPENELALYCCDMNKTAKLSYGDFAIELFLSVDSANVKKIAKLANLLPDENDILNFLYSNFGNNEECFDNIKSFFKANDIAFQFSVW